MREKRPVMRDCLQAKRHEVEQVAVAVAPPPFIKQNLIFSKPNRYPAWSCFLFGLAIDECGQGSPIPRIQPFRNCDRLVKHQAIYLSNRTL